MRKYPVLMAIAAFGMLNVAAFAQTPTQLYSFEAGDSPNNLDGFSPNNGGTVFSSTIGVTSGTGSIGDTLISSDYFSGLLTTDLPAALNSPETEAINFDFTIVNQFAGTFADIGIVEFGLDNSAPGFPSNDPVQSTANANKNVDLPPGTYNITIPLQALYNPVTGEGPVPFSSCFTSDPNAGLVALTGFEIYVNKSTDDPFTFYIDNVKAQPLLGDTNDDFKVNSTDLDTVIANMGKTVTGGYADGDFNGDGVVNADDFTLYQYGVVEYNFLTFQPLPEPACMGIIGLGLVSLVTRRRRK